jgi:glycosyltransferase involved in cell wall biosynthesis
MIVQVPLFCLRHGKASGLESAVLNLVRGFAQIGTPVTLPIASVNRLNPDFANWVEQQRGVTFQKYPMIRGGTWTRFFEETMFLNTTEQMGPILFPNYFLPPTFNGRSSSTFCFIHDCQHRVFPQFFSKRRRLWLDFAFRRSLNKAAHVLLISEFEKAQIARFFGEKAADHCTVVYNAIDWSRYAFGSVSPTIESISEHQYILSVSHQYAHKNTEAIIDAFRLLADIYSDLNLVLVGRESQNVSNRINAIENKSVRERIISTGFVSDVDLGRLYTKCQLFVLASEYEGFGMSAVEAMGFGVPVIVTKGSSLPEVTLGKATYVEPKSSPSVWSDAISEHLSRQRDELALRNAAIEVRTRFQPESVAKSVLKCLITY